MHVQKVSEYDQEIPKSHIVCQPIAQLGKVTGQSQPQDIMKTIEVKKCSLFLIKKIAKLERTLTNA